MKEGKSADFAEGRRLGGAGGGWSLQSKCVFRLEPGNEGEKTQMKRIFELLKQRLNLFNWNGNGRRAMGRGWGDLGRCPRLQCGRAFGPEGGSLDRMNANLEFLNYEK